jgi:polyhydroxybutyrate depolymerase
VGGPYERWTGGTDDVGFIDAMVELIRRHYAIDGARIYVTGHSNGSRMTYRVGHELACKVAAIAPHSGQKVYESDSPAPCPVPVLHLHALDDASALYDGATTDDPNELSYAAVETVIGGWAGMFGCSASPAAALVTEDYTVKRWPCPGGHPEIELYAAERGDHHWFRLENSGIPATDLIWEFFTAHPKR